MSMDQNIIYPIACKYSDYFKNVIEKLYQEYPELRTNKEIYFLVNGNVVNKEITIEQNKIKGGSNIILNIIENDL